MGDDRLLAEQRAYYRARAPEYDEWWQRRDRYDRGKEMRAEWDRQVTLVDTALETFGAAGDVLELAGGTGWWTQRLAATAASLTVLDASLETLTLNRERAGRADIAYVVADLFTWTPRRQYDVVFFSFWLSHVPRARFAAFWELMRACLVPGGRVFLLDNRNDPVVGAATEDPYVAEYREDLHIRHLNDGSEHRVVKVMYEADELTDRLAAERWSADLSSTRWFIFGAAEPR